MDAAITYDNLTCDRDVQIQVAYLPDYAAAVIEGRLALMGQIRSASGAAYEGAGYGLHSKGDEAIIYTTGGDQPILYRCQSRS